MDALHTRRRRGFTLIEVMLVLLILMILGGLAATAYGPIRRRALDNAAKSQIGLFKTALDAFSLDVGDYPATDQGLDALMNNTTNAPKWNGPYIQGNLPMDPWGRPYQYQFPGKHNTNSYDIWSMGADGQDGTEDDLGNWE